jgi:hypothetical protein
VAGRPGAAGGRAARDFALAGLAAGVAYLSRNDGVLVLAVLLAAAAWDRLRHRRIRPGRRRIRRAVRHRRRPWAVRQLLVFGQLSPSTASGRVLYIRNMGEWDSITTPRRSTTCSGWESGRCSPRAWAA